MNISTEINTLEQHLDFDYFYKNLNDNIILELIETFKEGNNYIDKVIKSQSHFNYQFSKINIVSEIPLPTQFDAYFIPSYIIEHIQLNSFYKVSVTCKLKSRTIHLYFVIFDLYDRKMAIYIKNSIRCILTWFYILDNYTIAKNCSKNITLYIYLTDFMKSLPNNQLKTIDTEHVNTGYTSGCKEITEIVIYRKEEWFKVLIHETFHNFGLDFSDMNLESTNAKLRSLFNVNIEYNLYESYCETWARIINCMFYAFFSLGVSKRSDNDNIMNAFLYYMKRESIYSLIQLSKILQFLSLNFHIISDKKNSNNFLICSQLYKENTSVFSYYVITGLLINNFSLFINWCKKNNTSLFQFKKTPTNLSNYIDFISKSLKNKAIRRNISIIENWVKANDIDSKFNGLKMTHLNIISDFYG